MLVEKYYREALGNIYQYASERKECSSYLETIEKMALDALHGKNLTSASTRPDDSCPNYHKDAKEQGWFICPYCDKKLSSG